MAGRNYSTKPHVTVETLRAEFEYNPETGVLRRVVKGIGQRKPGVVGCKDAYGYLTVYLAGRLYKVHRLAWAIHHGRLPNGGIDHINGKRDDNRIENLREVDFSVNAQNRRNAQSNNLSSGKLGASFHKKTGKWSAYIGDPVTKKKIHLGLFCTADEAHSAYLKAKRQLHPGCTI